ncbi:hypothetical protein I307_02801 [Cryptococcus deuterogattii 99/473]|uniref:Mediator of RNA polymerase II transcription subunit 7 n=2 Tax=Cryptococcus deuterogattii TaxID=1859096 RepID=A0A0D0SZM6_9TREE|nr:hypothetical protein CNBG_4837 [Cryptococcus deuterogattii R265]KIR27881.1 hypothetical protein I309_03201 [Cryptococcus deuterogattii LA55]KIR35448.1 hypothetical protein I352_01723 [Cryptococcus deuterogattii MMRL2647]KIR38717.1 hypothetical protein I313_05355 [Cryptococcus deuterogattii Ram5]KIR70902.1 hypothetical protein I310_05314 [Cryptococcus deuterogattii CA1014]KIR90512.1 hypothetical protein I304_05654 [Cryptococcus deuterogattii CBS 10090]KIY57728.1 hypothetical protein I307_02
MSNLPQEAALPITNTLFPPPPPYFQAFTDEAIERYEALTGKSLLVNDQRDKSKGEKEKQDDRDIRMDSRMEDLTEEEQNEKLELERTLGRPRADWVIEDGRWMCFGTMYTTEPVIPTAQSIGLPPFVDPAAEPQESLPPLLHSFLHTLLLLLDTLTMTARTPNELAAAGWASEGDQYIQHLTNLSANMMVASNQLRSAQSEATLVLLMEKELEERRKQTEKLRSKCKEIASGIRALKGL